MSATLNYQGVGRRFLATIIDGIILGVIMAVVYGVMVGPSLVEASLLLEAGLIAEEEYLAAIMGRMIPAALLNSLLSLAYYVVLEALAGGTLGKLIVGLRVVREDGSKIGFGAALIRNLLRVVDGFFAYLVGAVIIWSTPRKQRLGDILAKTIVVKA